MYVASMDTKATEAMELALFDSGWNWTAKALRIVKGMEAFSVLEVSKALEFHFSELANAQAKETLDYSGADWLGIVSRLRSFPSNKD